jgi:hypothetical protein
MIEIDNLGEEGNVIVLHQARETLKTGEVAVPELDYQTVPLPPDWYSMTIEVEHAYHLLQVGLQQHKRNPEPVV